VQTDIVVLNCDVCCSFPLTAMLGMLTDLKSTFDFDKSFGSQDFIPLDPL